jgi:hypothetical protein
MITEPFTNLLTLTAKAKASTSYDQVVLRLKRRNCFLNAVITGLGVDNAPRKNINAPITAISLVVPVHLWCLRQSTLHAFRHFNFNEPLNEGSRNQLLFHGASPNVSRILT